MDNNKRIDGRMIFFASANGIGYYVTDQEETKNVIDLRFSDEDGYSQDFRNGLMKSFMSVKVKGVILSGQDFVKGIMNHTYTNMNGNLKAVFVDDCLTNIGIVGDKFLQGKFLVDIDYFKHMCEMHKVEVDWELGEACPILFDNNTDSIIESESEDNQQEGIQ